MGRREMGLIFILFCSTMASSSSLQPIFPTESINHQQTNREKHGQDGVTYQIGRRYGARAVTVSRKGGRGIGGGGSGGRFVGGRGVFIGGASAVGSNNQGRLPNAGNRHVNMGLMVAAILAAIAHMYRVF